MSVSVSRRPDRHHGNKVTVAKRRLRLWTIFMLLFLGWSIYTYMTQMFIMKDLSEDLQMRQREKTAAEKTYNQLQQEVNRLNTTEYILQIARSRGMVLPDEVIIRKHDE